MFPSIQARLGGGLFGAGSARCACVTKNLNSEAKVDFRVGSGQCFFFFVFYLVQFGVLLPVPDAKTGIITAQTY